ncbi:MAG: hypothetical protein A3H91_09695 [Gammaproteobacteria bacterium RIFCSPLOWO2_02_FULL_61_13]|nr:MAG: hypothetical protein A3H91_09695 [Gammaproteobacteria bacterium RIFCSPLOWO2_02_FULL_61_13]
MSTLFRQAGQSMVEYTVVLVFGVLALTTGPSGDVIQELLDVIKENYKGYSYALSLSEAPDFDSAADYALALEAEGLDQDQIDRLAVDTPDALKVLQFFNRDPSAVLSDLKTKLADPTSVLPSNVGDVMEGAGGIF